MGPAQPCRCRLPRRNATAIVADIGGTTTDIALLQNGAPRLKPDGALVGGWQTMVEAADIRTCGLGGDSEVTPVGAAPRAASPRSTARRAAVTACHAMAAGKGQAGRTAGCCRPNVDRCPLCHAADAEWRAVLADPFRGGLAAKAIEMGLSSVAEIAGTQLALGAVDELISRGL